MGKTAGIRSAFNHQYDCALYWKRGRMLWAASKPNGQDFGDLGSGRDCVLTDVESSMDQQQQEDRKRDIISNNQRSQEVWRKLPEAEKDVWCKKAAAVDATLGNSAGGVP